MLDALSAQHELQVVVSGRAHTYLNQRASDRLTVNKIWGCTLVYEDNELHKWRTMVQNVNGALTGLPKNARTYFESIPGLFLADSPSATAAECAPLKRAACAGSVTDISPAGNIPATYSGGCLLS